VQRNLVRKHSPGKLFNFYYVVKELHQVINVGLNMVPFRTGWRCNEFVPYVMGSTAGRDNDVFEIREEPNEQLFRGASV